MALNDFQSVFLPYCLKKIQKDKYIVLNREYKPLGFKTYEKLIYENYPILIKIKRLTNQKIKAISWDGDPNNEMIFLYSDGCIPTKSNKSMTKYLKRLEILAKLKVD